MGHNNALFLFVSVDGGGWRVSFLLSATPAPPIVPQAPSSSSGPNFKRMHLVSITTRYGGT